MSESKQKATAKPIVDVAQPGKTAPPLTSKPVIVTNRTILKDPMVVEKTADDTEKSEATSKTKATEGSDIQPTETTVDESVASKPEHVLAPSPTAPTPEPEAKEVTPPPAEKTAEPDTPATEEPAPDKTDSQDAEADNGATLTDAQIEAEATAEAAREAEVQKLIESKKYYVPVNAVEKRRTKRVIALGVVLSIILALAWVDIALDAGLIDMGGVKPVTHFFSN